MDTEPPGGVESAEDQVRPRVRSRTFMLIRTAALDIGISRLMALIGLLLVIAMLAATTCICVADMHHSPMCADFVPSDPKYGPMAQAFGASVTVVALVAYVFCGLLIGVAAIPSRRMDHKTD